MGLQLRIKNEDQYRQMKPLFSIIIPVRQSTDYLKETLAVLSKINNKYFEVLVITDKISIKTDPSTKRNIGAKKAKGDYLVFLDDDSFPSIKYFKYAQKLVNKYPNYAAFCGPCLTPSSDSVYQKASGLVWSSFLGSGGAGSYRNSIQNSRFVDDYPTVNLIVKKTDFWAINGFQSKYWPGEDTILCLDIVQKLKKKIFYYPKLIVFHHRRSVIFAHLKQLSRYALHRGLFAKKFPQTSFRIGYLTPSFFLIYCLSLPFIFQYSSYFLYPLYLYLSLLLTTFFYFVLTNNSIFISFLATITIPITHLYYGFLFLVGFFSRDLNFKPHHVNRKTGNYVGG